MPTRELIVSREEVVLSRTITTIQIDYDYSRIYDNLLMMSLNVRSPWSVRFALWLVCSSNLTQDNEGLSIVVGSKATDGFKRYIQGKGGDAPKDRTMKEIINELVESDVLKRIGWGIYEINRKIFSQPSIEAVINGQVQNDSESGERVGNTALREADS